MNRLTDRAQVWHAAEPARGRGPRQWLWFFGLWCGGLAAAAALAGLARWVIRM